MKKLLSVLLIILISTAAYSQQGRNWERIHAFKMGYITDRLHLSPRQSSNFVPIYNEYEHEIMATRQSYLGKYKNTHPDQADDATSRQFVDDNLDYQQQVISIKRKYNERFLSVLSPQQLTDLYIAEREFKQILMRRLNNHRGGRFR